MTISVVQSASTGSTSATLSSAATPGNTLVLIGQGYGGGGGTFSAPTYNGASVTGATEAVVTNPTAVTDAGVYASVWILPNISGSSTAVTLQNSGGVNGFVVLEVSGLGTAPTLDANGGVSQGYAGTANFTSMPSGSTPALSSSSALLIGTAAFYAGGSYIGPGGWTNPSAQADYSITQYQIVTSSTGQTYNYTPTIPSAVNQGWASMIAAIAPSGGPTNVSVSDNAGQVESQTITVTAPIADFVAVVETAAITVTAALADYVGQVESNSIAVTAGIADFAAMIEAAVVSATVGLADQAGMRDTDNATNGGTSIAVSDFAGAVEAFVVSVSLAVHDNAGALDTFYNPSNASAPNPNRPAIVLVAASYAPIF